MAPPTAVEAEKQSECLGFKKKDSNRCWSEGPTRPPIEKQEGTDKNFPWRTWPWRILGDRLTWWLGVLLLAIPGPFMGILIGSGELSMAILKVLWRVSQLWRFVPDLVRSATEWVGARVLRDPRDAPFVPHMLWLSLYIPSLFAFTAYQHSINGFSWTMFFLYHFLRIGPRFRFFAHLHVLVHREGHDHQGVFRGFFRVFNYWPMQWLVGPFFGQVPNSYGIAHNKIHHRYDNGLDDVHTNLDLDRSQFTSFIIYVPRFFLYWIGVSPLAHFILRKEWRLARKMFLGMLYHTALFTTFFLWNPTFAIAYLGFPIMEAVIFFAGISYMWHCFVDENDPYNPYVSSVTILKGQDNIWNEDFHVVHHDALSVHWSLAPKHFEEHRDMYAKYHATIFEDTEEGALLFWMLSGNWDELAKHFVDLNGKMTVEEKKQLLLARARFVIRPADKSQ